MHLSAHFLLFPTFAFATITFTNWQPPVPGDLRSPCPALNALANHNIIPHNGRNLTVPMLETAFLTSMNISPSFTNFVGTAALILAPDKGASGQFSLKDIAKRGVPETMEHDASLSRKDFAVDGDATSFSPRIFREFLAFLGAKKEIGIQDAARARWGRVTTERRRNSKFEYNAGDRLNSYIQSAIYMQSLVDNKTKKVPVEWIKIWFEQERLPYREGWRPTTTPVTPITLAADILLLALATPEKIGADGETNWKKDRGPHGVL
ncbi:Chloroperoxidase [Dendryphion nanum]|uniref:Chloroperoxidase n=1 Tax=Dendryphion nanum TaxID=256645 RepID=A0A9P9D9W3_9PLEO|nr:Chloroperoxidase [Dendryphion nanum]